MSNKNTGKYLIIGGLVLALAGIAVYVKRQIDLAMNYCYGVAGAIIHKMGISQIKFTLIVNIYNRSDIDITISNQRYKVYANGMLVSKVYSDEATTIKPHKSTPFKVVVDFNPQDLLKAGLKNLEGLFVNQEKLNIELNGFVSVSAGFITVKNYQITERMSLKEWMAPSDPTEVTDCPPLNK